MFDRKFNITVNIWEQNTETEEAIGFWKDMVNQFSWKRKRQAKKKNKKKTKKNKTKKTKLQKKKTSFR